MADPKGRWGIMIHNLIIHLSKMKNTHLKIDPVIDDLDLPLRVPTCLISPKFIQKNSVVLCLCAVSYISYILSHCITFYCILNCSLKGSP